jgi:hypothetical protein
MAAVLKKVKNSGFRGGRGGRVNRRRSTYKPHRLSMCLH